MKWECCLPQYINTIFSLPLLLYKPELHQDKHMDDYVKSFQAPSRGLNWMGGYATKFKIISWVFRYLNRFKYLLYWLI